jgi:hypothetical protein
MKIELAYSLFNLVGGEMGLLISVPGASLSAGKNYEKAQVPAFSKTEFFLGRQVSLLVALLLRGLTLAANPVGVFAPSTPINRNSRLNVERENNKKADYTVSITMPY